jgi:hypothetical protein
MAKDVIYTAISLGTFGLSPSDPQIPHWYYGASGICGTVVNPEIPTDNPSEPQVPMGTVNVGNQPTNPTGVTVPPQN